MSADADVIRAYAEKVAAEEGTPAEWSVGGASGVAMPPTPLGVITVGTPSPHTKATFIVTYDQPECDTPVEVRSDG